MRTWRLKRGNISLNISPPAREPPAGHRLLVLSQMYLLTEAQGLEKVVAGTGRGVEMKLSGTDRLEAGVVRRPPPWCPVFSYEVTYDSCLFGA